MVRIIDRTIDDLIANAQDTLQNSLIETTHSFTYNSGTLNYTLPGFDVGNERIYSIESVEGVSYLPENYITEEDLTEGVDYALWDNYAAPEIVPDGYGVAVGDQVFTGITITDQTFKDGSTVFIKYKYQNPNYIPILTNFSANSVLRMILTSTLLNLQLTNAELHESIDSFGLNARGDDLDRIATLIGLERFDAKFTTGQIKLTNNATTTNYNVTTSHRFAAISGGSYLAFAPLTSISVPSGGGEVFIDVIAVEAGSLYNVGSNSISNGFTNIDLTIRTPDTLVISNPPLGDLGQQNLFNNGADEETDDAFRKRVTLRFSQAKTSSYSTVENAALSTGLITDAKTYDIETKKNLNENDVQTYVATEGARLSATSLSQINDAIFKVKPVGSLSSLRQVMNTYIDFDFTIFVDKEHIGDTAPIETNLNNLIDQFINDSNIGQDIYPSTVISIFKAVAEVEDIEINSHTVTEFSSEVAVYDGQISLATAGVADNWVAIEVPLNSATHLTSAVENTITGDAYELASNGEPYPIDDRTPPRVNIGVNGYDGIVRASPLDRTDYRLGGDRDTITYDPATVGGNGIETSDLVLFNYNYFDNTKIDGFRIRLGGDSGTIVAFDFGFGSDPNSGNFRSFITDESLITEPTVTLDGSERIYDVPFSAQIELDNFDGTPPSQWSPEANTFWLIIKYDSAGGDAYIPVDTQENFVPYNPTLFEDADADGVTFETSSSKRVNWYSYTTYTNADAYKKIVIPSQTDEPEKPISYTHNYTFSLFKEE